MTQQIYNPHRLYRSRDHQLLGGVAAGIAEFFGRSRFLDPFCHLYLPADFYSSRRLSFMGWLAFSSKKDLPGSLKNRKRDVSGNRCTAPPKRLSTRLTSNTHRSKSECRIWKPILPPDPTNWIGLLTNYAINNRYGKRKHHVDSQEQQTAPY